MWKCSLCTSRNYDMDWNCTECTTDKRLSNRLDDVRKCKKSTLSPKGENCTLREPTKGKR